MSKDVRVIGKGITSCAVKPALPCKDGGAVSSNLVGKVMIDKDAREEVSLMETVKRIDPYGIFTLQGVQSCIPEKDAMVLRRAFKEQGCSPSRFRRNQEKESKLRQLILPYGGIPLSMIHTDEIVETLTKLSVGNIDRVISMIYTEITRLVYSALRFREMNMCHCDLHLGNILFNPSNGRLTVIDFGFLHNGKTVAPYLLSLRGYDTNIVPQHPTELPLFVILANKKQTLQPLPVLSDDIPDPLLEAIEEGALGRTETRLRREIASLSIGNPLRSLGSVLLPEKIPGGDAMYRERCMAIIGMREMTSGLPGTLEKSVKAFRFAIETIDSFAIGNVVKAILGKIKVGFPEMNESHLKILRVLRIIGERMSSPNPADRISAKKAFETLLSIRNSVGQDPRGNSVFDWSKIRT